ncbi:TetR family transcriptional regulator [Gordonia sp. TBRC 11910]|uniref:TetR family transcriptional regulator n=1 Tax=Gordonia asplenii TaxID=2725283 RepID=A0A848KPU5_9ACTN|nr:TetR family transcriptional regulator [Gordonia asplenii]
MRRAVLDATLDLLHRDGLNGVAVADVAAAAGVHETSIYRRWGKKENLIVEALLDEAEELIPIPDTGTLRDDLTAYATSLTTYLMSPIGTAFDRALAALGDDPASVHTRSQYWQARTARSTSIVTRAIERGEIADVDPLRVIQMLVAPLHFRVVMTHEPLTPDLPAQVVDIVLNGLKGGPEVAGSK